MVESFERIVKVGFARDPKLVFDEIEVVAAEMIRQGWYLKDTLIEDGLACVHLFFERFIEEKES
ncbi:MAG: hypothetical protein GX556_04380 [Fibrobacter sp.]|nr:hypothetical protein [Fibrobacter sp.]